MAATKRARKSPATESRWSQLVREAKKDLPVHEPYVFDAVDPPLLIAAPDGLERSLALARLLEASEDSAIENLIPMLEALVGEDAFAVVWSELRNEPIEVALALIDDIGDHFNASADEGAEEFPGESRPRSAAGAPLRGSRVGLARLLAGRPARLLPGELPWAKLARFLRQLPPGSRYQAAIDADFDIAEYTYARQQLDAEDGPSEDESGPQVSTSAGYDLSVQTLMTIADLIQQLQATLIAVNLPEGKTPPKPRFLPRPVTALDVVRARHAVDEETDQVGDALSAFGF